MAIFKEQQTYQSREYYTAVEEKHRQRGRAYCDSQPSTALNLHREWNNWAHCCRYMDWGDPLQALKDADPSRFVVYLDWHCDHSRFTKLKRLTVRTWWKRISENYLKKLGYSTSELARKAVREALAKGGRLHRRFNLNTEPRPKHKIDREDWLDILSTLWWAPITRLYVRSESERNRLWLFEHLAGYTGSRPGALVHREYDLSALEEHKDDDEFRVDFDDADFLSYKHCTLDLWPPASPGLYPRPVLKVELRNVKNGVSEGKPAVVYILHATPCLAMCPVMSFVRMALEDDAFADNIKTPEDFFATSKIPSNRSVLHVRWKDSVLDTPIFRSDDGEKWTYQALRKCLVRLGNATGYRDVMTTYCLRRGFGNAIHGKVTLSEQNKAMNHSSSKIFDQYYQDKSLGTDVQNCFLELPREDALVKVVTSMRSILDRSRPTKLTVEQRERIYRDDQDVQKATATRDMAKARCRLRNRSINKSKGTKEYQAFLKADSHLRRTRHRVAKDAFQKLQDDYERSACSTAINSQIEAQRQRVASGQPRHDPDMEVTPFMDKPARITRTDIPENPLRQRIARQLFADDIPMPGSREDIDRRISVLTDMLRLSALGDVYDIPPKAPDPVRDIAADQAHAPTQTENLPPGFSSDEEEWNGFSDEETDLQPMARVGGVVLPAATHDNRSDHRASDDRTCVNADQHSAACTIDAGGRQDQMLEPDTTYLLSSAVAAETSGVAHEASNGAPEDFDKVLVCENSSCGSKTTSGRWAKTAHGLLCHACRLYLGRHGRLREHSQLRRPKLRRVCSNAMCRVSAPLSHPGHYASCGWLCVTCSEYHRNRGCLPPRPLVWRPRARGTSGSRDTAAVRVKEASQNSSQAAPASQYTALAAPMHLKVNDLQLGHFPTASSIAPLTPPASSTSSCSLFPTEWQTTDTVEPIELTIGDNSDLVVTDDWNFDYSPVFSEGLCADDLFGEI